MMWKYLLMAAAVFAPIDAAQAGARELTGTWGGERTIVIFGKSGAEVQSDCANGTIQGPIRINAAGKFAAKGTFQSFGGGPQAIEPAPMPAAQFGGHVSGKTLVLTIRVKGSPTQTLTLREGVRHKLIRCL